MILQENTEFWLMSGTPDTLSHCIDFSEPSTVYMWLFSAVVIQIKHCVGDKKGVKSQTHSGQTLNARSPTS